MIIDPRSPYTVALGAPITLTPPPGDVVGVELTNVSYYTCLANAGGNKGYVAPSAYRSLMLGAQGQDVIVTPQATPGVSASGQLYVAWLEPTDQPGGAGTFTPPTTPVQVTNTDELAVPAANDYVTSAVGGGVTHSFPGTQSTPGLYTLIGTVMGLDTSGSPENLHEWYDNNGNMFFSYNLTAYGSYAVQINLYIPGDPNTPVSVYCSTGLERCTVLFAIDLNLPNGG